MREAFIDFGLDTLEILQTLGRAKYHRMWIINLETYFALLLYLCFRCILCVRVLRPNIFNSSSTIFGIFARTLLRRYGSNSQKDLQILPKWLLEWGRLLLCGEGIGFRVLRYFDWDNVFNRKRRYFAWDWSRRRYQKRGGGRRSGSGPSRRVSPDGHRVWTRRHRTICLHFLSALTLSLPFSAQSLTLKRGGKWKSYDLNF